MKSDHQQVVLLYGDYKEGNLVTGNNEKAQLLDTFSLSAFLKGQTI